MTSTGRLIPLPPFSPARLSALELVPVRYRDPHSRLGHRIYRMPTQDRESASTYGPDGRNRMEGDTGGRIDLYV